MVTSPGAANGTVLGNRACLGCGLKGIPITLTVLAVFLQAETRAEFAERSVAKLEKTIDDLEGKRVLAAVCPSFMGRQGWGLLVLGVGMGDGRGEAGMLWRCWSPTWEIWPHPHCLVPGAVPARSHHPCLLLTATLSLSATHSLPVPPPAPHSPHLQTKYMHRR